VLSAPVAIVAKWQIVIMRLALLTLVGESWLLIPTSKDVKDHNMAGFGIYNV